MEHHANIVPWQIAAEATGAKVVAAPVSDAGELLLDAFVERITERTRMIAVVWVSNVLGTVNPVHELVRIAHARGLPILIDAAQAVQHIPVDVQELGADFLVFSGHKLYGPSGVGVLHGKAARLEAMPPYQGGGDMIERVSFAGTTWNEIPFKFEAGHARHRRHRRLGCRHRLRRGTWVWTRSPPTRRRCWPTPRAPSTRSRACA